MDLFGSQPASSQKNVDLFASQPAPLQKEVDLFATQPAPTSAVSSPVDFFAAADPITKSDNTPTNSDQKTTNAIDPFAAVPLNNFDGSDPFGAFAQNPATASSINNLNAASVETKPISHNNSNGCNVETKPPPKKDAFQVKSGIWADSLSRGLIDLNITARKFSFWILSCLLYT